MSFSLSLSLLWFSLIFFLLFLIDTKRQVVCAYICVALSRFVCSVLDGSVSLCELLIFLPPHRICVSLCMCMRMCAFASLCALCLCQLLILYKHTHTYACACLFAHTHTHRRWWEERHTEEVGGKWKRNTEWEREDHLIHQRARWLLCCLLDRKHSQRMFEDCCRQRKYSY